MKMVKIAGKNKVIISKQEWKSIGKKAGWIRVAKMVSNCCSAEDKKCEPDCGMTGNLYSDIDMCPKCKNKCQFVEQKESKTVSTKTAQNKKIIKKYKLSQIETHTVRVTLSDGDVITTRINGTKEEINSYYYNNEFVADDETTMRKVVAVEFLDENSTTL